MSPDEQGLAGFAGFWRALDWEHLHGELDREVRSRVMVIGCAGAGKHSLVRALRALPSSIGNDEVYQDAGVESDGFFVIATPLEAGYAMRDSPDPAQMILSEIERAELVLVVVNPLKESLATARHWLSHAVAAGKPVLVAASHRDRLDLVSMQRRHAELTAHLGVAPRWYSVHDQSSLERGLIPALLNAAPALATALGREIVIARPFVSQSVVRNSALISALAGAEPVPMLDLPLQILVQMRMLLRVSAIFGRPVGHRMSREFIVTLASATMLRILAAQAARMIPIPILGSVVGAMLSGASTYGLGQVLTRHYAMHDGVHLNRE